MNSHPKARRALSGIAPLLALVGAGALAAPTDPPIDPADARILWRWIGINSQPSQPCPDANIWEEERLFEDPALPVPPPGLARYCIYELPVDVSFGDGPRTALRQLVQEGSLRAVEPDQMVLAAEAEGQLPSRLFRQLSEHFLREAGQSTAPLAFPTDGDAVRLTLIDTQPTGEDPELFTGYESAHGYTLATLAERLLCNGVAGECAADVRTRLALGNVCFDPLVQRSDCRQPATGGWFGAQTDLARAIRDEVVDWTSSNNPSPPPAEQQHLILNLSLGWNRLFGGDQGLNAMPLGAASVYSALQDASCRGALVLAAAGNQHGGPAEPGGPIYPAGWEQRPAPSFLQCRFQLIETGAYLPRWAFPMPLNTPNPRSLVVAVGGVQYDNSIIYNGRPNGGEPRLVAFADHAATESLAVPNTPTVTLTGTSVATTVVAAAAAVGWRFDNGRSMFTLLEDMAASGTDLGREADFCRGGRGGANPCPAPVPSVQRVQLCATIECVRDGNCSGSYMSCPTSTPLTLTGVDDIAPDTDFTTLTATLTDSDCEGIVTHYDPTRPVPANPCLSKQFHGVNALPWLDPQPGDLPCPNCFVQFMSPGVLYYEIDPQLMETFTDATLLCGDDAFVLPFDSLASLALGAIDNVECPEATPIQLQLRDSDGRTHISPVLYLDDQ